MATRELDAVVVGSGPNGLAAAVALAETGVRVRVLEREDEIGGGTRSAELTLPGFVHDVCSAVHPMGILSPFFRRLPLAQHGLEWVTPPASVAHPLDDRDAVMLYQSLDRTCDGLGNDAAAYRRLLEPLLSSPHATGSFHCSWIVSMRSSEGTVPCRFHRYILTTCRVARSAIRTTL